MKHHRVITSKFDVDIDYVKMLERYSIFLISLNTTKGIHTSVYAKLEEVILSRKGSTVIAFDIAKEQKQDAYRRIYLVIASKPSILTKPDLTNCLPSDTFTIEEADAYALQQNVRKNHILNALLTLLPNMQFPTLYAHGKYLVGGCKDWNKGRQKRGEYIFLNVFFDYSCCLRSQSQTLTHETQFDEKEIRGGRPYFVTYSQTESIHLSTSPCEGDTDKFYDFKPKRRKQDKNSIPFLCYKDLKEFKESQVYVLNDIITQLSNSFSEFLTIRQETYHPENTFLGRWASNQEEDLYVKEYIETHNVVVETLDDTIQAKRMKSKVEDIISEICPQTSDTLPKAVFRIVPSLKQDDKLPKEQRNIEKTRQSQHKKQYHDQKIAVQDITEDHDDINEATIANLLRQLAAKDCCLNGKLPQYVANHFDGCNVIYGILEKGVYQSVILKIAGNDVSFFYDTIEHDNKELWIDRLGVSIPVPNDIKSYDQRNLFIVEKDGVNYLLYNTNEFVFPEVDVMASVLLEREKQTIPAQCYEKFLPLVEEHPDAKLLCVQRLRSSKDVTKDDFERDCSTLKQYNSDIKVVTKAIRKECNFTALPQFKNNENVTWTLSAFSNITFWEIPNSGGTHWCYSVGLKSRNYKVRTEFPHKTHIHHIHTKAAVSKDDIENLIIDSLQDGWLRMNEFSVEPSIFKFAREAMEIYYTKKYACGTQYIK